MFPCLCFYSVYYVDTMTTRPLLSQVTSNPPSDLPGLAAYTEDFLTQHHRDLFGINEILNPIADSYNGSFYEQIDFTVSSDGSTITGSLEQEGGGDLTMFFSDGAQSLICTPACTVTLTPQTGSLPETNFVYILESDKLLTSSTSDWPTTEHIRVAYIILKTAAQTQSDSSALGNQNWNDGRSPMSDNRGHQLHKAERLRAFPATWHDGAALVIRNAVGDPMVDTDSSTLVDFDVAEGEVYQLHLQTFPRANMADGADIHIVNQPTDEGGAYATTEDMVTDLTHIDDGTDAGVAIGGNKYFNLTLWGVQNRSGEESHLMVNLPTGQYSVEANALADTSTFNNDTIPAIFTSIGFLIARITFRLVAGPQWTLIQSVDLRGSTTGAGGTGGTGEANTASNQGVDGVGCFIQKTGVDLEFRHVAPASSKITVVDNANDIDLDIIEAQISHGNLGSLGNGSDHSFIDQDVTSGSSPTFVGSNFTTISADDVNIVDIGVLITATEVEGALQEHRGLINTNTTHISSDGSDHSFIDQSVVSGANVTFGTIGCGIINSTAQGNFVSTTTLPGVRITGTSGQQTRFILDGAASTTLLTAFIFVQGDSDVTDIIFREHNGTTNAFTIRHTAVDTMEWRAFEDDGTSSKAFMTITQPGAGTGDVASIAWAGAHGFDDTVGLNAMVTVNDNIAVQFGPSGEGTIKSDSDDMLIEGDDSSSDLRIGKFVTVNIGTPGSNETIIANNGDMSFGGTASFFSPQENNADLNANVAGTAGEIVFNLNDVTFYGCTVTGGAGAATWVAFH